MTPTRYPSSNAHRGRLGTQHRLWTAMRIMREFSTTDLQAAAEVPSRATACEYLAYLRRAGFIRSHRPSRSIGYGTLPMVHALIRNTGPKPPAIVRLAAAVWDPNTDQEYPI